MNRLAEELVRGILGEEMTPRKETVAIFAGGFKPPTLGHLSVVQKTLEDYPEIDKMIIYVGSGERDSVSQEKSIAIWRIYQKYLPAKVEVQPSPEGKPPVGKVYSYAKKNPDKNVYMIVGSREGNEGDEKDFAGKVRKLTNKPEEYPNLTAKKIDTGDGISGTRARKAILDKNKEAFLNYIPDIPEKEEIWNTLSEVMGVMEDQNPIETDDQVLARKGAFVYMKGKKIYLKRRRLFTVLGEIEGRVTLEDQKGRQFWVMKHEMDNKWSKFTPVEIPVGLDEDKMSSINLDQKKSTYSKEYLEILNRFPETLQREIIDERPKGDQADIDELKGWRLNKKTPYDIPLNKLLKNPENLDSISRTPKEVVNKINLNWGIKVKPGTVYDPNPGRYFEYATKFSGDTAKPSIMVNGVIAWGVGRFIAALLRGDKTMKVWDIQDSVNEYLDQQDVEDLDDLADRELNPIDVDLSGNHFFDRLNDPRNTPEIDYLELEDFFTKLGDNRKEFIDFLNKYKSVVATDTETNINIPFMKMANKAIAKTIMRKRNFKTPNEKIKLHEKDPKKGTGKKPKGSGRRLYTDENPKDTVKIKFSTRQDIVDTLNKKSFKSKSHARQSQVINLIHQRVRAAYGRAKKPEVKERLKTALDYITKRKEASKAKTKRLQAQKKKKKTNEALEGIQKIDYYLNYYTNVSPSIFDVAKEDDNIIISGINNSYPQGFDDIKDIRQVSPTQNLNEGDTYEKMAAKGKKAGNLKQGTVRKRLNIPKGEKVPMYKIDKEISRLKKMDKDKDKKGVQLGDKNQKYYKALQLAKTLKSTTNVDENVAPNHNQKAAPFGSGYKELKEELTPQILSLTQYMDNNGLNLRPYPKVKFINDDAKNANNLLGRTAYYNPTQQLVALYTMGRHPKDILRSYAHELIHHHQNLSGTLNHSNTTNTNEDDDLEQIEREAYEEGNILFRNWEDEKKNILQNN